MADHEFGTFGDEVDSALDRYFEEGMDGDVNDYLDAEKIEHPQLTVYKVPDEGIEGFKPRFPPCPTGYQVTEKLGRRPDGSTYIIYGCKYVEV